MKVQTAAEVQGIELRLSSLFKATWHAKILWLQFFLCECEYKLKNSGKSWSYHFFINNVKASDEEWSYCGIW